MISLRHLHYAKCFQLGARQLRYVGKFDKRSPMSRQPPLTATCDLTNNPNEQMTSEARHR